MKMKRKRPTVGEVAELRERISDLEYEAAEDAKTISEQGLQIDIWREALEMILKALRGNR